MPGTTLPSDQSRTLDGGFARTERIERQTRGPGDQTPTPPHVIFSYPGVLASSTFSPPWYPSQNITVLEVRISITLSTGADNVIDLFRDVSLVSAYTLPAGDTTIAIPTGINVDAGSRIVLATASVSGSNLAVQLTYVNR